jgi:hypothetical protein
MTHTDDREQTLARIEAKLDALLGIPAAPPELDVDGLRGVLAAIDSFHSQMTRGFDQIQATLADVIARDAIEAARVRAQTEAARRRKRDAERAELAASLRELREAIPAFIDRLDTITTKETR